MSRPWNDAARYIRFHVIECVSIIMLAAVLAGIIWPLSPNQGSMVHTYPPQEAAAKAEVERLGGGVTCWDKGSLPECFITFPDARLMREPQITRIVSAANRLYAVVRLELRADISKNAMRQLASLRDVRSLILCGSSVDSDAWPHLTDMPRLASLDVRWTNFDDDAAKAIARSNTVMALSLDSTAISDMGLSFISTMPLLKELSLCRTGITDVGLTELEQAEKLHDLALYETHVSETGLKRLRKALRQCLIHY